MKEELKNELTLWLIGKSEFRGREDDAKEFAKWAADLVFDNPKTAAVLLLERTIEANNTRRVAEAIQRLSQNPSVLEGRAPVPIKDAQWILGKPILTNPEPL